MVITFLYSNGLYFYIVRLNKHDTYVNALSEVLQSQYDIILTNVPLYSKRHRLIAEIDILALLGREYDVYEVKCSHRITKARKQLSRIRKLLTSIRHTYFYCGSSNELVLVRNYVKSR